MRLFFVMHLLFLLASQIYCEDIDYFTLEPATEAEFDVVRDGHGRIYWVIAGNQRIGNVTLHPGCTAIEREPVGNAVRIWTYWRGGGWVGTIGYYKISGNLVEPFEGITIYPGDNGTKISRTIMNAVFSEEHRIRFDESEKPLVPIIRFHGE